MMTVLTEQKSAWQASGGTSFAKFTPSFLRDVYPTLKRALDARNVHRPGTTANQHYHEILLKDFTLMSTLTGPKAQDASFLRKSIFAWIRKPNGPDVQWKEMPRGLGEAVADMLGGNTVHVQDYQRWTQSLFNEFARQRCQQYEIENSIHATGFWRERAALPKGNCSTAVNLQ
jgi:hypothetical protein